jgi:hypothetical protein
MIETPKERRYLRVQKILAKRGLTKQNAFKSKCSNNNFKNMILCQSKTTSRIQQDIPVTSSLKSSNTDNVKKEIRKLRNRESAERSRQKRNDESFILSNQIENLVKEVVSLKNRLSMYEKIDNCSTMLSPNFVDNTKEFIKLSYGKYTEPAVFSY